MLHLIQIIVSQATIACSELGYILLGPGKINLTILYLSLLYYFKLKITELLIIKLNCITFKLKFKLLYWKQLTV